MKHVILGVVAGLLLGSAGTLSLSRLETARQKRLINQGWEPVEVLLLAKDLEEGAVLAEDALVEGTVPEQFVTESFVRLEDRRHVVGQRLGFPLQKGDALVWGALSDQRGRRAVEACAADIRPKVEEAGASAFGGSIERFASGIAPTEPVPAQPPVPRAGEVPVVVAVEEIREGEVLQASQLGVLSFPAGFVTASFVRAEMKDRIVGTLASSPMVAGDAVLWQNLDDPAHPSSVASCTSRVGDEREEARHEEGARLAKAFYASHPIGER